MNRLDLFEMVSRLSPSELEELVRLMEELKKMQNLAPPSDDDFLAALGPCGK